MPFLYQNDDYGKDYVKGLKDGLNGKMRIVAEAPYEATDPTVDSQIINLKASGTDVLPPEADKPFLHRMRLGLLGELGARGPICDAGGGAEPSSTPITDRMAIRTISP
jgi:branched-chain amino acid transport system substrate-binding protein